MLRRTWREFRADGLTDWAAALTYYGILALFPGLLVLVSILGLIGRGATQTLIDNLAQLGPGQARDIVTSAIRNLQADRGAAGVLFVVSLAGALWSASGYISAFMRAANAIWDVEEGRPIWKTVPLRLAITLVTLLFLTVGAIAVVVTGPLARRAGDLIGAGATAVTVWDVAKWPVLVLLLGALLAVLYYAAPNVRQPGLSWLTPGGVLAVLLWAAASALFALYVANFGSYNRTYGSLGGAIVFLVWLWITNVAILLGAELNAELTRERQIEAGVVQDGEEPYLPERS